MGKNPGTEPVVRIHKGYAVSLRLRNGKVTGRRHSHILQCKHPQISIRLFQVIADSRRLVRGAVVDHQNLQVVVGLGLYAVYAVFQIGLPVMDGHNYADQLFFHPPSTFS